MLVELVDEKIKVERFVAGWFAGVPRWRTESMSSIYSKTCTEGSDPLEPKKLAFPRERKTAPLEVDVGGKKVFSLRWLNILR